MSIRKCVTVLALSSVMAITPALIVGQKPNQKSSKMVAIADTSATTAIHSEGEQRNENKNNKEIHVSGMDIRKGDVVALSSRGESISEIVKDNTKAKAQTRHRRWKVPLSADLQDYISKQCQEYGVPESLAYSVIDVESSFNPNKISQTNDYGLFQINFVNRGWLGRKFGVTNWFNPYQNAKVGIYMLGDLIHKYGSFNKVLIAYNGGEGYMQNLFRRGVTSTSYYQKVMNAMGGLQTT